MCAKALVNLILFFLEAVLSGVFRPPSSVGTCSPGLLYFCRSEISLHPYPLTCFFFCVGSSISHVMCVLYVVNSLDYLPEKKHRRKLFKKFHDLECLLLGWISSGLHFFFFLLKFWHYYSIVFIFQTYLWEVTCCLDYWTFFVTYSFPLWKILVSFIISSSLKFHNDMA